MSSARPGAGLTGVLHAPHAQGQLGGIALSFVQNFGIFSGASGVLGALSRGVASLGADQATAEQRAQARPEPTRSVTTLP